MDTVENIRRKDKVKLTRTNTNKNKEEDGGSSQDFKIGASALSWGLMAGAVMAGYLILLQMSSAADSTGMKFIKYIFLFGFMGWGLWKYRLIDRTGNFFRRAIPLAVLTSFYAALTLALATLIVGMLVPDISFDKFGLSVDSPTDNIVISGTYLFEAFVFGMISGLIWLQYLKYRVPG